MLIRAFAILTLVLPSCLPALAADSFPPIPRVLPPEGLEIPADVRSRLEKRLEATKKRLEAIGDDQKPDVEVFTKAVELALIHREFYVEKDFAKADWALDEANKRLDSLTKNESPWRTATGTVVAGYHSSVDGSAQPYGLVIPKDHDFSKPCPLYVWLHGRGDKSTDLHFLQERSTKPGQITPPNAIVVHPFGRHCVGWKHAGETDVLEVVVSVKQRYKIDPTRIVLIGFSMGGAGAWHIGAHFPGEWIAVLPGAGFVDVAKYQKLTPGNAGPWYVQKLWGVYDVPDYVRNFFNTTIIAYSGELDKQREAAVIMEEAFQAEDRTLTHLIGPGVEHKYEPETLKELVKRLDAIVTAGRPKPPEAAYVQTRTLQYAGNPWLTAERLNEHWVDSRIDAQLATDQVEVTTKNIAQFVVMVPGDNKKARFTVDGQSVQAGEETMPLFTPPSGQTRWMASFVKENDHWKWLSPFERVRSNAGLVKRRQLQGPIDDAFRSPFVIVAPTGKTRNPKFQRWMDFELNHFCDRWRALMRGEPPIVSDTDVELGKVNLNVAGPRPLNVGLWGDPDCNRIMQKMIEHTPVKYNAGQWTLGDSKFDGDQYVPSFVFPRKNGNAYPAYIVLNSGLTFREAHDRTNSQQNPKLPDWAIIDITQPPDANSPGHIHDADFFDENWQLKRQPKTP